MGRSLQYIVVILTAVSAFWISREPGYDPLLSSLLVLNIVLAFPASRRHTAFLNILSRMFLGLVFLFSGYVKLVDPMGSMYKFEDYFIALGLDSMIPASLYLGVLLSVAEVLIGLALIFRLRMRFTAWVLLLFMLFFLPLTTWLAITNDVTDCGCFGDVLILTNWQTFFKNLVFLPFTIIIFINRKNHGWRMRPAWQWVAVASFALVALGVSIYSYRHLPPQDFRAWKVGSSITVPQPPEVFLVYVNNGTGEQQEWKSADLPWQDSAWVNSWSYLETRTVESIDIESNYFTVEDGYGTDMGQSILLNPDFQLLVVSPDLGKAPRHIFDDLNILYDSASAAGIDMALVCANLIDEIEPFRHEVQAMYPFFQADDITLKTVIRSNPGLLLLRGGVVMAKWHYNDLPDFASIRDEFMTN